MEDLFIKAATVIAVALATFSSFPGTAQPDPVAQQQRQSVSSTAGVPSPGNPAANPAAAKLSPVTGELVNKLDAKSAKQGDTVVVKTDQSVRIDSGAQIPKGSKLVGHVTNVETRGDGRENSQIAVQFDRAELKDGQSLPIESVIRSIAPAGSETMRAASSSFGADSATPISRSGAAAAAPRENPTAGGMSPNTIDENRPEQASNAVTAQAPLPAVQPGTDEGNSYPVRDSADSSASSSPAPGAIVAQNGNIAIRATAIPGVLLGNDIHGMPFTNASGMLLSARGDVHLDGGTRIVLAVAAAQEPGSVSR